MSTDFSRIFSRSYFASANLLVRLAIRRQYRNTFFGMAWSLIQPFASILILATVMSIVMRFPTHDYAVHIISGMIPWQFFVACINQSAGAFTSRHGVLHHSVLPRTLFVVADVGMQLYIFACTLAFGIVIIAFLRGGVDWTLLALPIAFVPLLITALALSFTAAYLTPYFYDIPHFISLGFQVIFWTIPIVYPISMIPEKYSIFFELNPVYMIIHPMQMVIYDQVLPSLPVMMRAASVALLTTALAYITYKNLRRNMIYYL